MNWRVRGPRWLATASVAVLWLSLCAAGEPRRPSLGELPPEERGPAAAYLEQLCRLLDTEAVVDPDDAFQALLKLRSLSLTGDERTEVVRLLACLVKRTGPLKVPAGSAAEHPLMTLKAAAVKVLVTLRDKRALPSLVHFYKTERGGPRFPASTVVRAIRTLQALPGEAEDITAIAAATPPSRRNPEWRSKWLQTPQGRELLKLVDEMGSEDYGVAKAARAALWAKGDEMIEILVDTLGNHESYVARRSSAYLLGQSMDMTTTPALIKAFYDENRYVRWGAITASGVMEDKRAVPDLVKLLNDPLKRIRVAAATALMKVPDVQALDGLLQTLDGKEDGVVRGWAAKAIGKIGDQRGTPVLIAHLDDKEIRVRRNSAFALAWIADPRAARVLFERFDLEDDLELRDHVREALARIAGQGYGIPVSATEEQRAAAIGRLREYWKQKLATDEGK